MFQWSLTDKFRDYLYDIQFDVCPDLCSFVRAKLEATRHRWLAALSSLHIASIIITIICQKFTLQKLVLSLKFYNLGARSSLGRRTKTLKMQ